MWTLLGRLLTNVCSKLLYNKAVNNWLKIHNNNTFSTSLWNSVVTLDSWNYTQKLYIWQQTDKFDSKLWNE